MVLKIPYYSNRVTETLTDYAAYRGKLSCKVYTMRFNFTSQFNNEYMIDYVLRNVMNNFKTGSRISASIQYDLLLVDPTSNPSSYYIWRANTNLHTFDYDNELNIYLSYNNLFRFIHEASHIDIPTLSLNFRSSNVTIERVLAVVFTFASV